MKLLDANCALRNALDIKDYTSANHKCEISRIAETHGHTIRFISERADETCAPYALQLTDDRTYRAIAKCCNVFAGNDFMVWVTEYLKEIFELQSGCLICYYSVTGWKHVGIICDQGRVTSKWGTYPLYEHGAAEVPAEYGDCVRFFERPSSADALSLFIKFAHISGVSDSDITAALSDCPS